MLKALLFLVSALVTVVATIYLSIPAEELPLVEPPTIKELQAELQALMQERDSLLTEVTTLQPSLARSTHEVDSLSRMLANVSANSRDLESRLQAREKELQILRTADINAEEMAKTFATMSEDQLGPIVTRLSDDVVLSIYKHTANKRRKNLLAALGDNRAAALTNKLIRTKGR